MKFTVQRSDFLDKLTPAMGTVSNKNTIASIEGILMETLNGDIRISSYDMNKGVRALIHPISIEREGKYIVNAQRLYQTVRVMPDDELTVEVDGAGNCSMTCGKSSFSMHAMNGSDFPNMPELLTERGFTVSASLVKKMIGKVAHSVAEDASRPQLCGAFFKIADGRMEVVSCDGYSLSVCREKCDFESFGSESTGRFEFIVPGHALGELCKILPDGEEDIVKIYLSRKHAIFHTEDLVFFTRTVDSEYVDYKRIMPTDNTIFVEIERERLLAGLERANIIAEEKIQGSGRSYVKINVTDQSFCIASVSVNGKVYDEVDCVHEGADLEIGFSCRLLINAIRAAEGENVKLSFKGTMQAMTVEPTECDPDHEYFYMVLPLRMNTN